MSIVKPEIEVFGPTDTSRLQAETHELTIWDMSGNVVYEHKYTGPVRSMAIADNEGNPLPNGMYCYETPNDSGYKAGIYVVTRREDLCYQMTIPATDWQANCL